jgi:hypothetical protein
VGEQAALPKLQFLYAKITLVVELKLLGVATRRWATIYSSERADSVDMIYYASMLCGGNALTKWRMRIHSRDSGAPKNRTENY